MCYDCEDYYSIGDSYKYKTVFPCNSCKPIFEISDVISFNQKIVSIRNAGENNNLSCTLTFDMEFFYQANPVEIEDRLVTAFHDLIVLDKRVFGLINQIVKEMFNDDYSMPKSYWDTSKYVQANYQKELSFNVDDKLVSYRPPELDTFPGLKALVKYPGKSDNLSGFQLTLERAIINLNDKEKWTREQIADWLETLDVDITFKTKETDEQPRSKGRRTPYNY